MKIITPIVMTDAKLTSTNMTENDHAVWVAADYVIGDLVISTTTHRIYRCIVAHLLASPVDPDTEWTALDDPLIEDPSTVYWQLISATNIWKLFDEKPSDVCANATIITARITPSEIVRGIGLFGVLGEEVKITMTDPVDGVVFDETISMQDETVVIDWWTWWFEPITQLAEYVSVELPPYADAYIDVTITNTGGTAQCGQIVLGPVMSIGNTLIDGSGWSILDYSFVNLDVYGNLSAVERNSTRLSDFSIEYDTGLNLAVSAKLKSLRGGKAAVWVGSEDSTKAAQNYGILLDARPFYQEGDTMLMSVKIQGLV